AACLEWKVIQVDFFHAFLVDGVPRSHAAGIRIPCPPAFRSPIQKLDVSGYHFRHPPALAVLRFITPDLQPSFDCHQPSLMQVVGTGLRESLPGHKRNEIGFTLTGLIKKRTVNRERKLGYRRTVWRIPELRVSG